MTKREIRNEAYEGTNGEYLYEGFSADQWRDIARERDYERRDSSKEWDIVAVLDELDEEAE